MAAVEISLVFEESGARISPLTAKLLLAIRQTGSISGASREAGMPYKKAWMLLDSLNQAFREPVATAILGGLGGGGATLTQFGAEVLETYQRLAKQTAEMAAGDLKALGRRAMAGRVRAPVSSPRKRRR